ncbi:MAG: hypothetical protein ACPGC0_06120, partial [Opitutales bacterium]
LNAFARNDKEGAMEYLRTIPPGVDKNTLVKNLAQELTKDNPLAALDWAATMSDKDLADRARNTVLREWAERDPVGMIAHLEQSGDTGALKNQADVLADSYARQDAPSAAIWALSLKDPSAQVRAVEAVIEEWLDHDTYEATVWISELDKGPTRDKAVQELVQKVRRTDTPSALTWGLTIDNQKGRTQSVNGLLQTMKNNGQEAEARKMLKGSDLPEGEVNKYLEILKDKTT